YVSPTVVKVCVREIRHALGDETAKPQFIETVGSQGYRFISPLRATPLLAGARGQEVRGPAEEARGGDPGPGPRARPFVGRAQELAQLEAWYARVQQGQRQLIFVSGEAGIGKTTLVEHFVSQLQARGTVRLGYGHCIEQGEQGEAYLPVLQAL